MKFGSAIIFLLLIPIALGFLISDNFNTREELAQIQQKNQQLSQELLAVQAERDVANEGLVKSEQKISELTQQNLAQQEQIRNLSEESANLKEQNAFLQKQTEALKFFNSFLPSLPKALSLAIFLPIIPVSMAATYVVVRYNKNHKQHKIHKDKSQRKTSVQLTDDEVKEIIRIRRTR